VKNEKVEDYFVILYSTEKLNIKKIKSLVEYYYGDFKQRLKQSLGKSSINSEDINFSKNKIEFKYKKNKKRQKNEKITNRHK